MTEEISSAMKVESCDRFASSFSDPMMYYRGSSYMQPSKFRAAQMALERLEQLWAETQEIHEANKPALSHNQNIVNKIKSIMRKAGIANEYVSMKFKSPRSRVKTRFVNGAGYLEDLCRHFKTEDGFQQAEITYNGLKVSYEKHREDALREVETKKSDEKRALEVLETARRADIHLAQIIVRYGLPDMSDWRAALEALRAKNKYADLAVAGYLIRSNWSDGFGEMENALGRFRVDNVIDQEIYDELSALTYGAESDGRIFRDCFYNYTKLFDMIGDQTFLFDLNSALEHVGA